MSELGARHIRVIHGCDFSHFLEGDWLFHIFMGVEIYY